VVRVLQLCSKFAIVVAFQIAEIAAGSRKVPD